MSQTPPMKDAHPLNGGDHTPELASKREKRHREDDENDRDKSSRHRHRHHGDDEEYDRERERERERRHRHRHRERDDENDEDRRERRRRHHHEDETEEEREERRKRRKEREMRERDYDDRRGSRDGSTHTARRSHRDRSRESHRSHRSRDVDHPAIKEMTREEKEAERAKRDREMQEERREAARLRDERFAEMDRERERERRMRDRPHSPPRRMRNSPDYEVPPPPREPPPPKDPVNQLLDEVDSESRSIFVSQLAARMTSSDLGMFFEDKLGRGAVRDARVVTDRGSRRSKGIGYVELDSVEMVNRALGMSGNLVMGIPIMIQLTESEKNREGQVAEIMAGNFTRSERRPPPSFTTNFPPLSTGLAVSPGVEVDAHADASIPYHRLFVSNLAFSLSSDDVRQVFEAFGTIEFVDLHVNFSGETKGTAYVQFKDLRSAQMALDAMHMFELAGRPIKVQTISERSHAAEQIIEDTGYGPRMDATQRQQLMFKLARTEPNVNLGLSAPQPVSAPAKPANARPSEYVIVGNMFNPDDETERNWDLDLAEDVKGEVEKKYGQVRRIKVDKMSAGDVYIEFETIKYADTAVKGLNGRFFGGRQLRASYITEALFKAHL